MAKQKFYPVGKRENIGHVFSYYYDVAKNRLFEADMADNRKAQDYWEKKVEKAERFFNIVLASGEVVYATGKDWADMRNAVECYRLTH